MQCGTTRACSELTLGPNQLPDVALSWIYDVISDRHGLSGHARKHTESKSSKNFRKRATNGLFR